jgi:hypothetical protein
VQFHGFSRCRYKEERPMMRVMVSGVLAAAIMVMALCTTGCDGGGSEIANGGGSEITNGKLVGMSGAPLAGRTVEVYPETYIYRRSSVSSIKQAVTAGDGTFELDIDSGAYNLYFVDTATGSGVCVREIVAGQRLGTIRLDTLGAISGTIRTTDTSSYSTPLIIFSKGVPLFSSIASSNGLFRFESVPPGTYPLSLAKMPPAGCAPGEDCLPGDSGKPALFSSAIVDIGKTAVVDTIISIDDVGTLR